MKLSSILKREKPTLSGQWKEQPGGKLEVPEKVWKRMNWKIIYHQSDTLMKAWCHGWEIIEGGVILYEFLVDTSSRVSGITMEQRITLTPEAALINIPVTILPLVSDD